MATYYVRKTGSDSNAGTSAGAAWLTIGKALGASGISSGDTVYIGAGTYREIVTVNMTSATAETKIIGDVDGSQTGDAGEVIWTAHVTDDVTVPSSAYPLVANGRDFITIQNVIFYGGTTGCINMTTATSTDWKFYRCSFLSYGYNYAINYTGTADTAANLTIDSCEFWASGSGQSASIIITAPTSTVSDYDLNISIYNCVFNVVSVPIKVISSGANPFKGGGVDVFNSFLFGSTGVSTGASLSTTYPLTIYNSVVLAITGLSANTSGQIVEDYNIISASTARTNVTAGSNSKTNTYAPGWTGIRPMMQRLVPCRPFAEPCAGSKYLGFGAQAGGPTTDITGANRPSGGASTSYAVGAYERGNCATQEASTVHAGTYAAKITGPGYHDFQVRVDATSTTISIYARYDTNHGTTNKPQISVLNGGQCGVADATATMTSGVDTWEQLQLTFTPTAAGIVTIRCISRSAAGNGIAIFDS